MRVRFKSIFMIAIATSVVSTLVACRLRDTSEAKKADDTAGSKPDPNVNAQAKRATNLSTEIQIVPESLSEAKPRLATLSGTLRLWSMLTSPEITAKLNSRLGPYKLENEIPVAPKDLTSSSSLETIKARVEKDGISLSGFPGNEKPARIATFQSDGHTTTRIDALTTELFNSCPSDFFAEKGPLTQLLSTSASPSRARVETAGATPSVPVVKNLILNPGSLTWTIECAYALSWDDIPDTKVMAELDFSMTLTSDKVIFPTIASDKRYPSIPISKLATEQSGHGTRFGRDYSNAASDNTVIHRWNPMRERIVIDDMFDAQGNSLTANSYGALIHEGIKIAAADLRIKFPGFGKKIVLRSEQPALRGDIIIGQIDPEKPQEPSFKWIDNQTGEIRKARVNIGAELPHFAQITMLRQFAALDMVQDSERAIKDAMLMTVMHDIGHALGLRHNFSGYGTVNSWGADLQSIMSFSHLGIPPEYLTDHIEWKPHDLISLQILYSELDSASLRERAERLHAVLAFPLSPDDGPTDFMITRADHHLGAALNFLNATNHPRMTALRKEKPDWREQITRVYNDSYGIDLKASPGTTR